MSLGVTVKYLQPGVAQHAVDAGVGRGVLWSGLDEARCGRKAREVETTEAEAQEDYQVGGDWCFGDRVLSVAQAMLDDAFEPGINYASADKAVHLEQRAKGGIWWRNHCSRPDDPPKKRNYVKRKAHEMEDGYAAQKRKLQADNPQQLQ